MTHHVTWREMTLRLEVDIAPFRRGRLSGPIEDCYPDEGGYAEIHSAYAMLPDRVVKLDLAMLGRDHVKSWEQDAYQEWERECEESKTEEMMP